MADPLASRPLAEKVVLLKGRLIVAMPKGSVVEGREPNIMGAPEPDDDETRVVLEEGPEKLVLMSNEFHATAGQDLGREVEMVLKQLSTDGEAKFTQDPEAVSQGGLSCVFVRLEGASKQTDEARLVEGLFVKNSDGTVQYLAVYLNPEASKSWKDFETVAHSILNSVAAGSKEINLEGRSIEADKDFGLALTVAPQMMVATTIGPDFNVLRCYPLRELGAPESSLNFYFGFHPSFNSAPDLPRSRGRLLGQQIDWQLRKSRGSPYSEEALVAVPGRRDAVVHVFMNCADELTLREMKSIAETLRVTKPAPEP